MPQPLNKLKMQLQISPIMLTMLTSLKPKQILPIMLKKKTQMVQMKFNKVSQ
jgi:hypothetical protein